MEAIFLNEQFTINISANIYLQALHNSKHSKFKIFKLKHGQLLLMVDKQCYKICTGTKELCQVVNLIRKRSKQIGNFTLFF